MMAQERRRDEALRHSAMRSARRTRLPSRQAWPAPRMIFTFAFGIRAAIARASRAEGMSRSLSPAMNSVGA